MNKITHYQLLIGVHDDDLNKKVNKALSQGWQPFGSPFSDSNETNECTQLCQAVVIYEDQP